MKCFIGRLWQRGAVYLGVGAVYLISCGALIYAVQRWGFPGQLSKVSRMRLSTNDKTLITLASVGAAIAFGKLLVGGEKVTLRLVVGRLIIGAGLSMAAATALMMVPNVPPIALVGLGSALGILGQSFLEKLAQRYWSLRTEDDA